MRSKEKIPQTEEKGIILSQINLCLQEMKEIRYNLDKWNKLTLEQMKEFAAEVKELQQKKKRIEKGATAETIITGTNKETNQEIEFNLEAERQTWQTFYENHNFKDKVEIPELFLTEEQIKEIQTLIEQGFVDKCAVIPDHLTYQELLPEMAKEYEETYQGSNFKEDKGFDELDKLETPQLRSGQANQQYRLIFFKKAQNLGDDTILKQTKGKSPDKMDEYLKEINKKLNTDIQGISLKDYLVTQRQIFETENKHMDEQGWTWCLKSRFKNSGRVVHAGWSPDHRQLQVHSSDASGSGSHSGSRLSRSFPAEGGTSGIK
jgi:hypothetical protein